MYPDVEKWQARRESNPQPAVLETAALPIELLAYDIVKNSVTTELYLSHLPHETAYGARRPSGSCMNSTKNTFFRSLSEAAAANLKFLLFISRYERLQLR